MAGLPIYGLYAQRGINLLQVGALRLPCLMASISGVSRVAEVALRGISATLEFIGFKGESTFSKWVTRQVSYVRPYKNEIHYPTKQLIIEAAALAAIGIIGNTFVSLVFGPPPAIYNTVLQWFGSIRISNEMHPLFVILSQRFWS